MTEQMRVAQADSIEPNSASVSASANLKPADATVLAKRRLAGRSSAFGFFVVHRPSDAPCLGLGRVDAAK